jgi:glycosyltransferase involved in cell wall biosynthesis
MVLADRRPVDLAHGRDLRIYHLLAELARDLDCFVVDLSAEGTAEHDLTVPGTGPNLSLPPRPSARANLIRHLRLSDTGFPRRAFPDYFRHVRGELERLVAVRRPDVILNYSRFAAELVPTLGVPCVLDWSDSASLALDRAGAAAGGTDLPKRAGLSRRLKRFRAAGRERYLVGHYPAVTTISGQERNHLLKVTGAPPDRITVVPNGVGTGALDGFRDGPRGRSIVFWGNLDFPPNWTAVRHFHERVFKPYLSGRGLSFEIIGRGGEQQLAEVFASEGVTRHGFVDDLYDLLGRQGVMINPMIQGGGMKNKVLEAFASGIPVVSTPLGLDGIEARDAEHCIIASTPEELAAGVLRLVDHPELARRMGTAARSLVAARYTWRRSAGTLKDLIDRLVTPIDAVPGPGDGAEPGSSASGLSRGGAV